MQHGEGGPGPLARRRPRHRLHPRGLRRRTATRYDLILDIGGQRVAVPAPARAHRPRDPGHRRRRDRRPVARWHRPPGPGHGCCRRSSARSWARFVATENARGPARADRAHRGGHADAGHRPDLPARRGCRRPSATSRRATRAERSSSRSETVAATRRPPLSLIVLAAGECSHAFSRGRLGCRRGDPRCRAGNCAGPGRRSHPGSAGPLRRRLRRNPVDVARTRSPGRRAGPDHPGRPPALGVADDRPAEALAGRPDPDPGALRHAGPGARDPRQLDRGRGAVPAEPQECAGGIPVGCRPDSSRAGCRPARRRRLSSPGVRRGCGAAPVRWAALPGG